VTESVGGQLIMTAIPVIPLLVFFVLALFGRLLGQNAQYVGILGTTVSLVFSALALYLVASGGQPIDFAVEWISLGEAGAFPMGIYIDGLAAMMLVVVCFVSLMIQMFSGEFMVGDRRYAWYFAVLNLFTASMLGLVVAPNFVELYVFWELVGLCSYLLVGHWFEKPSARDAAQKAFIVTRVGDAALFVGIAIFWAQTGTTSFEGISQAAQAGFIGGSLFATAVVLVFIGAIGKSAQFPLHVWLPDAMEGPTPVSALIHAATMVAAGVYLVARTYDIFVQSDAAMLTVAYIGGFTAFMAATMALVKKDIKRIIAYSTVSQLGYMMLALGVGSFSAGMFHLYNHAFFKALLFLGAGSIIYAIDSYNLDNMGGLRRRMPVTFWAMVLAGLSLSGIFPFSGFWSKDEILAGAFAEHFYVLYGLGLITVFLTAFYIFRAIFVAFTGDPRTAEAQSATESPAIMTGPMVILAALAVVSGWIGTPIWNGFADLVSPSEFALETLGQEAHAFSFSLAAVSLLVGLGGIALAYAMYVQKPQRAEAMAQNLSGARRFLNRGWYFDDLYRVTFMRGAFALGRAVREFDRRALGGLVSGVGRGFSSGGRYMRPIQSGGVQNYALMIAMSVLVIGLIVGIGAGVAVMYLISGAGLVLAAAVALLTYRGRGAQ
jgi:NADH-quinone oxidoreductase subunit L